MHVVGDVFGGGGEAWGVDEFEGVSVDASFVEGGVEDVVECPVDVGDGVLSQQALVGALSVHGFLFGGQGGVDEGVEVFEGDFIEVFFA